MFYGGGCSCYFDVIFKAGANRPVTGVSYAGRPRFRSKKTTFAHPPGSNIYNSEEISQSCSYSGDAMNKSVK